MIKVARYLTTERPLPDARITGYDYVLAGNGLFKRARSRHLEALIQIAPARVAGLPELEPYVRLTGARLPVRLLTIALQDARRLASRKPIEAMYHIYVDDGQARLARPRQTGTAAHLQYAGGGHPAIICDLHSHCQMHACFSTTDDRDEVGFRFYATMGRIFTRPEIVIRLGMYGDFSPCEVTDLFTGQGLLHAVRGDGLHRTQYGKDFKCQPTNSKSPSVTASRSGILSVSW